MDQMDIEEDPDNPILKLKYSKDNFIALGSRGLRDIYDCTKMKMDHPNIVKLYEVFESDNSLYLIMEECYGGELFDRILHRINTNNMYTEREACLLMKQIIGAIEYCHNNGIAHRDLKPENLLYLKEGSEEDNPLKIADFGLSQSKFQFEKNADIKSRNFILRSP